MNLRKFTAIFYLLGSLAIGLAVLLPFAIQQLYVSPVRNAIEAAVRKVAEAEVQIAKSNGGRFRYLSAKPQESAAELVRSQLRVDVDGERVAIECLSDKASALVIRGTVSPKAIQSGMVPPMMFLTVFKNDGADVRVEDGIEKWIGAPPLLPGVVGQVLKLFNL